RPLSGLEIVHLGGEAISRGLVRRLEAVIGPGCRVYNGYGPTETSINSTVFRMQGRPLDRGVRTATVPIGRPTANSSVWVLDRRGLPVPVGVPGELSIGGEGVARGYLNRPALTAERFVPDPEQGGEGERPLTPTLSPGGEIEVVERFPTRGEGAPTQRQRPSGGRRLYRSGDLVRWLPDGELEFLGRIDQQVKLRGLRIELGEIEAALTSHPAVRRAVVLARDRAESGGASGDRWLVAYVVAQGEPVAAGTLRAFLRRTLPDYMVPSAFVALEALPLGSTGKVDRRALPAPEACLAPEETFVAPRSPAEEMMAGIWSGLLRREPIGAHDHFFALGGHSLLATQLTSRVRDLFGVELELRSVFETPTLAGLTAGVERARRAGRAPGTPPIRPLPSERRDAAPLSFAQQRLWFLAQLAPPALYNLPVALGLSGSLERAALEGSLHEIVRRHQVLRSRLVGREAGEPYQVIDDPTRLRLPMVDLTALATAESAAESETELQRLAFAEAWRPFDLSRGPLLRALLLRSGEAEHALVLTMHHAVSDGWSVGILQRELAVLYEAFSAAGPSPLPEPQIQYADFAVWQRQWLESEAWETQFAYWQQQLTGMREALELPADRPRPPLPSFRGATLPVTVPQELTDSLRALSRAQGATLFMTALAALDALLARYSGQDEVTVGSPVANRNRSEIEGLIGFFVNMLPLRTDLVGNLTFRELVGRVREVTLGAYDHQDVPFE
ncbi:MAG: AMP-binding protein, partial [bacterium]|nr:AMP-binding protein [bacterium]